MSIFVLNGALDAYRRKQDAPGAVELLLSMKPTHGTAPDVCSYATALAACREAER